MIITDPYNVIKDFDKRVIVLASRLPYGLKIDGSTYECCTLVTIEGGLGVIVHNDCEPDEDEESLLVITEDLPRALGADFRKTLETKISRLQELRDQLSEIPLPKSRAVKPASRAKGR